MMSCRTKLLIASLAIILWTQCEAKRIAYSVVEGNVLKMFEVTDEKDIPDSYSAKAIYDNKVNNTGWAFLEIQSSNKYENDVQAYSAGFLEGALTQEIIWMYWQNTMKDLCEDRKFVCLKLKLFLDKNLKWIQKMINSNYNTDVYWHQLNLYLRQLQGVADGYNKVVKDSKQSLSAQYILAINLQGDLEDLFEMEGIHRPLGSGHCSALIKILPDGSDIYTSQVTWNSYQSMLRFQKKYILNYETLPGSKQLINGHTMSFSSYPGQLQSGDDFYILSSGLVTLETTIGNTNPKLWPFVTATGQVMEFARTMIANRLAGSGKEWVDIFSRFNSGTYNNQWMVVDYTKFKPGSKGKAPNIKPGLLWVLEQLPGNIEAQDLTNVILENTYWPSYNLPYYPNIFNLSGTADMVAKYGDWFSYDKHPRALIFKRDHSKINNMDDMLALMRYNDFKHDPLSKCECNPPYSAENAISARNDLNLANGTYPFRALSHRSHGGTDAKITNSKLMRTYQFLSVSGPTYDEANGIPPFRWSEVDFGATTPHVGHPDVWQFKPLTYKWEFN